MAIRNTRLKRQGVKQDPKKEAAFKLLVQQFQDAGFQVRREELKRGLGWRAASGNCTAMGEQIIFVDRRLSQDEQIEVLRSRLSLLAGDMIVPSLNMESHTIEAAS